MGFWEVFAISVSSAGTFASILGVAIAIISRRNGERTRQFIREVVREAVNEITDKIDKLGAKMDEGFRILGELIVADGERTRELIKELRK
jgi:hypothetical protein